MESSHENEDKKEASIEHHEHHSQITQSSDRVEKVKAWLKNPYNLALLGILVFSFIILVYYFIMTRNQPLWWDEAEYMATAKNWAFNIPYVINSQRPPLFPFLAAMLYKVGFSDIPIKFILEIIPAFLVVLFTYLLVKEMFDRKTALAAAFITSVSWIHIFYSMRFMTDSLGLMFGILALLCFWKGWVKKQGNHFIWLIGLFVALSFLCRLTGILYGAFIVLFLVLTLQFEAIKSKHMWLVLVVFLLTISPYLLWCQAYYGNAFAFRSGYGGIENVPIGWSLMHLVFDYPELIFFMMFIAGLIVISPMFLVLDKIILKKEKSEYNSLFMVLLIIFILGFFIYFLRSAENRWLIAMSIGIFAIAGKAFSWGFDFIKKNVGKFIAIVIILLILITGAYFELKHADDIIKNKLDSYGPVKDAGIWMKQNSNPSDIISSISFTQTAFYSERNVSSYSTMGNASNFDKYLQNNKPRFVEVSVFEVLPSWVNDWLSKNQNNTNVKPVKYYTTQTANGVQPVLVVYEMSYDNAKKEIQNINSSIAY